ncbi:PPK2 family polyphosphate kinase [Paenibacillus bovis]|uniref:Polyphosphate kinase n=1 Tax=Paenibacillus bovis TaxID=1616788 RepID=A0A172ZGH9_9BACL|nr:PPK2 family polyphosphate kinase [Paenibacillus bovis]ANF96755.1 polyphosphate kinase [Paenibacillus bovis]
MSKSSKNWFLAKGDSIDLKDIDPGYTGDYHSKEDTESEKAELTEIFEKLQPKLFASGKKSVLFVFQGMDCSGKDGVINKVFSISNPAGIHIHSFKAPTTEERNHDYLWRAHQHVAGYGYISAFNRSYYEDVLITRVHGQIDDPTAKQRFKQINHFEKMLEENGVRVVKIFLHISKEFQLKKLIDRVEKPHKNWKFDKGDLQERKYWDDYQKCYEDVFKHCASDDHPWHIIPADNRWYRDLAVLQIVVRTLQEMDLSYPDPIPELQEHLPDMYAELEKLKKK